MFNYKFPDIGEGITEGTLTKWLVKEGDLVKEGQDLAEIETDKMTTTLPSAATGIVHTLHVPEYGTLEVGKVFITIDDGSSASLTPPQEVKTESVQKKDNSREKVEEEAGVVGQLITGKDELPPSREASTIAQVSLQEKKKVLATPVARKMAKDLGVNIEDIQGSGPAGRVMKEDIQSFAEKKKEEAVPHLAKQTLAPSEEQRQPVSRMRKTIIDKMLQSKNHLVHTTSLEEVDVSSLVDFRQKMKSLVGEDVKLTYLPFIIKALLLTLKEFPIFNSSYDEEHEEIILKDHYNIGIATDTERGLVVPVLFDVDKKSVLELAKEIESLAQRARENQLTLEDLRGGSFSITNYGAMGGSFGTPIINYPELAILGIGRIQEKPMVKDGNIIIGNLLPLSLSFDHRIIDGASSVRFIRFLEEALQSPELLLLRS